MASNLLSIHLQTDELNRKLGGGIPVGSIFLLEGSDGGGKSIIAQRLLYGLLSHEHKATYISTELNLMGFITQMSSLNYNITKEIISEDLLFFSMYPQIGKVKLKHDFMNELLASKKIFSSDVIIFDTISYLLINSDTTREDAFKLISFIKKISALNKTIIACVDPDQCPKTFLDLLKNISDIYLFTEAKMVIGNLLHVANVIRYKGAPGEVTSATPFKVLPGAGFAIELASLA